MAVMKNWDLLAEKAQNEAGEDFVNVRYQSKEVERVKLPTKLFSRIIKEKRPEYLRFFPYDITIVPLDESEKNLENPYITKDRIIGIDDGDFLTLHIGSEYKPNAKSLLWLMLHEFRHKVQANSFVIQSCFLEDPLKKVFEDVQYTEDSINHVFHDLLPYEVDANVFACEMMDMPYKYGKWPIDFSRLKKKKTKNKQKPQ